MRGAFFACVVEIKEVLATRGNSVNNVNDSDGHLFAMQPFMSDVEQAD